MDYSQYRQRAGGPRAPPKVYTKRLQQLGRSTGKTFKKAWAPPKYRATGSNLGKYGSGGNVIAPTVVREKIVKYNKPIQKSDAALKTFSFNRCDYWSSVTGSQRVVSYPVMDYNMVTAMGTADVAIDSSSEQYTVQSTRQGLEICNTSNNTLSLKAYFLEALEDGAALPEDVYTTALGDAGLTADNTKATYIEPTMLPRFNRLFKTNKVEAAVLGAGSMAQFEHRSKPKRNVSLSGFSVTNFVTGGVTRYVMLVWHGAPARATTTAPAGDGSTIGPSQITLLHYGDVSYKSSLSNARLVYESKRNVQIATATIGTIMREDTDTPGAYTTSV